MATRRIFVLVSKVTVALVALATVIFFGFAGCLSTHYWWDRDEWNQERIANAYILFYKDKAKYPNSLADLVNAGYLPRKAEWYKEPPGFFAHAVDFTESCYVVLSPDSGGTENLKMVGRRIQHDGKEEMDFSPPINAKIRDSIRKSGK